MTAPPADPLALGPSSPIDTISPNDGMLIPGWTSQYFEIGSDALRVILRAMEAAGRNGFRAILDLPCGHGRVLRYLKARFPSARLVACDLDADGVRFCAETFGATGVVSRKDVATVPLDDRFDLIWCGSLLTHLDRADWPRVLGFFSARLLDGGLLVFTTHGRYTAKLLAERSGRYGIGDTGVLEMLEQYAATGFGFAAFPHTPDYGVSVASPAWVLAEVLRHPHLRVLSFAETAWGQHQDVVACLREADIFPARSPWDRQQTG